jgi:hypothetical protein
VSACGDGGFMMNSQDIVPSHRDQPPSRGSLSRPGQGARERHVQPARDGCHSLVTKLSEHC